MNYTGASSDESGRTPQTDWEWALHAFEQASGLNLVPAPDGFEAQVTVSWEDVPKASWEGEESTEAYGFGQPTGTDGASYAQITINSAFDHDGTRRDVIMHELGHLAGLGHVDDGRSVMRDTGAGPMTWYSPGDLAGLWALGKGGGCW